MLLGLGAIALAWAVAYIGASIPSSTTALRGQDRFLALCAENKGFNIQAFTSYEDAMEWLIAN